MQVDECNHRVACVAEGLGLDAVDGVAPLAVSETVEELAGVDEEAARKGWRHWNPALCLPVVHGEARIPACDQRHIMILS